MPSALILIADGTEEMEAVISIDVLRRAEVCFHFLVFYYIIARIYDREELEVLMREYIINFSIKDVSKVVHVIKHYASKSNTLLSIMSKQIYKFI